MLGARLAGEGAMGSEPWLRMGLSGPMGQALQPSSTPWPRCHRGASLPRLLATHQLGATLSLAPLSPQSVRTKFARFQHQVERGGQQVATCQQLAESLLEHGHSAAPKARQRQQDLQ